MLNLIIRLILRARMVLLDQRIDEMNDLLAQDSIDPTLRSVVFRRRAAVRGTRKQIGERYYALRRSENAKRDPETA